MTGQEIRQRFLQHFERREHLILDSALVVPADDPTTLFISAGMQPLQPYYKGLRPPPAPRLASCQKCFRTDDLEQVGRTDRHHTFFEMLGNFAPTGDYFKERAIPWAWEFVTDSERGLGLDRERLRVTTHPTDEEAREIWRRETDVKPEWIYPNEENWWGLDLGPCGPDSEIWWDRGSEVGCGRPDCYPDHCERFLEFWNLVFPQFDKQPDGSLPPLPRPAIDTGMGLDRVTSIVQGVPSVFDTDLFAPIIGFIREASQQPSQTSERIVADHLRGMTMVIGDGVLPSNEGRGYVLRRVVRRAALHARRLGMQRSLVDGVAVVVRLMRDQYPYLVERELEIKRAVAAEADAFNRTLERGMEQFEQVAGRHGGEIPGQDAFRLHDTFGIPLELTRELAAERGLTVDEAGFSAEMEAQRIRSRGLMQQRWAEAGALPRSEFTGYQELEGEAEVVALRKDGAELPEAVEGDEVEVYLARTPFYGESGGQVGDTGRLLGPDGEVQVEDTKRPAEGVFSHLGRVRIGRLRVGDRVRTRVDAVRRRQIMRHHTATHLLNKALEELTGERNLQRGSLVAPDHTTFDFPFPRQLTASELERLAERVNEQVRAALPLQARVLPYREAVSSGATHLFDEKYGDRVRVVCFGEWSCEFCGGTHVGNSADVGGVVITSEQSIGQGLRRLDLTVGEAAEDLIRRRLDQIGALARTLGVPPDELQARVAELRRELRESERQLERLRDELRTAHVRGASTGPRRREASVPLVLEEVPADGTGDLRGWADRFLEFLGGSGVVVVSSGSNFAIKVSRDMAERHPATGLAPLLGRGGGRPEMAQGRLTRPLSEAFELVEAALK
ncbi:MAG: alanine--tRNA ligase [Candidatus Dormibacteraeota bacterium]|nr:alanine--tRNA ligase [Candidatus Dormibacteraeota bacterium]